MRWAASEWIWITLLLVAMSATALLYGAWARRRALARFGDEGLVRALRDGSPAGFRAARGVLAILALLLGGLALARPQGRAKTEVLSRRGIDIVVCLDVSKSMLARDVQPSRINRAKSELRRLMEEEPGDRVGVVVFAGTTMEYPLTSDHESAQRFYRDVEPWSFPVGGTSIGRAITAAHEMFTRDPLAARRSKVILVLTDGEDLDGDPIAAARAAQTDGIATYVVAIGSTVPEPIPQFSPEGRMVGFERDSRGEVKTTRFSPEMETQLRGVVEAGHGQYIRPRTGEVGIEQLRRAISGLRRAEIAASQQTVYDELAGWFVLPAFVLLVLASTLVPERLAPLRAKALPAKVRKRKAKRTKGVL
ncbi:MAG: VWA domain-containing protein [Deltaproteobacteria bacterium]|nr:VWA domain-containing protein [Deltaproteobacteria bacterium]